MNLKLTPEQAQFLYNVLDQVNVSGLQAKALQVSIMALMAEELQETELEKAEPKRRTRKVSK